MNTIQWYPGHMTAAMRRMQEDIKLIDLMIELVDARIPVSGRNPDLDRLGQNKAGIIILNKSDLADPAKSRRWVEYFEKSGKKAVLMDARSRDGMKDVKGAVLEACQAKIDRDRKRGIKNRPVRAMVVGIPNVGKSTFINSYAGRSCAKTGDKPGVTKGKQWIKLDKNLELLDTPGVLWPKFEDRTVGLHLAMIGSINDEILEKEELAVEILREMKKLYSARISDRYGIEESGDDYSILQEISLKRGCLLKGGEADTKKGAGLVIDDFRKGRLGVYTLETAPDEGIF